MKSIKSFDAHDYINSYCDQLELEVRETIDCVVKKLNEIEQDLLKEIATFYINNEIESKYKLIFRKARNTNERDWRVQQQVEWLF